MFRARFSPSKADSILAPYAKIAAERGLTNVLLPYGEALILKGKTKSVRTLLQPSLSGNRGTALAWAFLAGVLAFHGQTDDAESWLEHEALKEAAAKYHDVRLEMRRSLAGDRREVKERRGQVQGASATLHPCRDG